MWHHLIHWILDHCSAFNDIGLAWIVPVLLVLVISRLFRPDYRRGEAEFVPVRIDGSRADARKPRSAA
jgi:hypothetical protein